jgi:hypothetical protein
MELLWLILAGLGVLFGVSVLIALVELLRQGQPQPPASAPPPLARLDVNLQSLDPPGQAQAPRETMTATLERAARPPSDTAWTETSPMVLPSRSDATTP